jgi:hypothetical protein
VYTRVTLEESRDFGDGVLRELHIGIEMDTWPLEAQWISRVQSDGLADIVELYDAKLPASFLKRSNSCACNLCRSIRAPVRNQDEVKEANEILAEDTIEAKRDDAFLVVCRHNDGDRFRGRTTSHHPKTRHLCIVSAPILNHGGIQGKWILCEPDRRTNSDSLDDSRGSVRSSANASPLGCI